MRQGQHQQHQQKRMRGRNNNNNRKGPNPLSRSYESNGPDVKIRGTAAHIADKYVQLARDAQSSGDPIAAESYFQHAEHYYRIVAAAQPQYPQHQGAPVGFSRADDDRDDDGEEYGEGNGQPNGLDGQQAGEPMRTNQAGGYPANAPQPYVQPDAAPRRERAPREPREPREPRQEAVAVESAAALPAFITGGQEAAPSEGAEAPRPARPRTRRSRFNAPRSARGEAGSDQGGEAGPSSAEPEVAPGE